MIEGCLDWQKNGLVRPKVVVDATADYFDAQDLLAQWLGERCEIKVTGEAASAALYRDWSTWTKARGEEPGTNKAFSATLELRHPKRKISTGAIFLGLRLLPNDTGVLVTPKPTTEVSMTGYGGLKASSSVCARV